MLKYLGLIAWDFYPDPKRGVKLYCNKPITEKKIIIFNIDYGFRYMDMTSTFDEAISRCSSQKYPSAALIRVQQIKYIDVDFAKSINNTWPIFRINGYKGK